MTNACVSHEMRTPLNSISAMNILKKDLYQRIMNSDPNPEIVKIMAEINNGMQIQDDSLQMLIFIVQNMLDYA